MACLETMLRDGVDGQRPGYKQTPCGLLKLHMCSCCMGCAEHSEPDACFPEHILLWQACTHLLPCGLQVYERTVYRIHQALTNNIRFLHGGSEDHCVSVAGDGCVKVFDLDLGESSAKVLFDTVILLK